MAMTRDCVVCGTPFLASRASARYCGGKCRARAARQPKPAPPTLTAVPPLPPEQLQPVTLFDITLEQLRRAERDHTALGQSALLIARRLENPSTDTGSSIASLVKEYRASLAAALEGTKRQLTILDELRERRRLRRAGEARILDD